MKALIALEDGAVLSGRSFTGAGEAVGEIVFNTSMSGYQEILTDPSYTGQLVTMTYPLIGNYGVNEDDMESERIHPGAFVMREYQSMASNFRANATLKDFLGRFGILGIEGVDTRMLTRIIRDSGAMGAVISTEISDPDALVKKAEAWPGLIGQDMVARVSCRKKYLWHNGRKLNEESFISNSTKSFKVVAYDFGIKYNQLRLLEEKGCQVMVVPATTSAEVVLALNPDGVFLSNGPGDPAGVEGVIGNIRLLLGKKPIFGICLGHQMLGLAYGGSTYKLKFGHRGSNQPVKDLNTGKVEITSQNHGFCVDPDSLADDVKITHVNLNDGSLAGMHHLKHSSFSVQYHPEHAPGPHDAQYLFDRFMVMMTEF